MILFLFLFVHARRLPQMTQRRGERHGVHTVAEIGGRSRGEHVAEPDPELLLGAGGAEGDERAPAGDGCARKERRRTKVKRERGPGRFRWQNGDEMRGGGDGGDRAAAASSVKATGRITPHANQSARQLHVRRESAERQSFNQHARRCNAMHARVRRPDRPAGRFASPRSPETGGYDAAERQGIGERILRSSPSAGRPPPLLRTHLGRRQSPRAPRSRIHYPVDGHSAQH